MDDYIDNILAENLTLKRKLESKCEATTILKIELERLTKELDRKNGIISDLKTKQLSSVIVPETDTSHSNDVSRGLRIENEALRQRLRDAQGDIQALRSRALETPSREERAAKSPIADEELVAQLEALRRSNMQLEYDLQALHDEKEELIAERDAFKCKLHRLNHECNVLLKGDTSGLIDLDALIMENRLLQERLLQSQEECNFAKQVADRYKTMVQNKKRHANGEGDGATLLTQKEAKAFLENMGTEASFLDSEATNGQLRSICLALLDSLGDKSLGLAHQKRANRILATRFAELQSHLDSPRDRTIAESPSKVLLDGYVALTLDEDSRNGPECSTTSPKASSSKEESS